MLYDLNIPVTPSTTPTTLAQTIATASSLGYDVLVLNQPITPPVLASITNTLPPASSLFPSTTTSKPTPKILHRATVTMHDHTAHHRLPLITTLFDLVAVRPTTDATFQNACTNIPPDHCALISLDMASPLPFYFRPKPCMGALSRGMRFEVCYSQALATGAEAQRARALFAANLRGLVRATKGRGIVVSSEARDALQLRAPADVVNLMAVWGGLGAEKGLEGLGTVPRGVVVNEGLKRSGFRGVVNVVEVAEGEGEDGEKEGVNKGKRKGPGGSKDAAGDGDDLGKRASKKAKKATAQAARGGAS